MNHVLTCSLISWFLAQVLKVPVKYLVEHEWSVKRIWGSGGMPSSHSALTVSLCLMTGFIEGFNSSLFALSFVLAAIVMYDATGVRRETGTQAKIINKILKQVIFDGQKITDKELKELVGHTPLEVFFGAVLAVVVTFIYLALM